MSNESNIPHSPILGGADEDLKTAREIKADVLICSEGLTTLRATARTNLCPDDQKEFDKKLKDIDALFEKLITDPTEENEKEIIAASAEFDKFITEPRPKNENKRGLREEEERLRYFYLKAIQPLVSLDNANLEHSYNQIHFKRQIRKDLWNLLEKKIYKDWCFEENNHNYYEELRTLGQKRVLELAQKHTGYVANQTPDDWLNGSGGYAEALRNLPSQWRQDLQKLTVGNIEAQIAKYDSAVKTALESKIESMLEIKLWEPDKPQLKFLEAKLIDDEDYKKWDGKYAELEKKIGKLDLEKDLDIVKREIWVKKLDFYKGKRENAETAFYSASKIRKIQGAVAEEWKKSKKRRDDYGLGEFAETALPVVKYVGLLVYQNLSEGKDAFDGFDTSKCVREAYKFVGPFVTFIPGGTLLKYATDWLVNSYFGAPPEESDVDKIVRRITDRIDKLEKHIDLKFKTLFADISAELVKTQVLDIQVKTKATISYKLKDVLNKRTNTGGPASDQIDMAINFVRDFETKISIILAKCYGTGVIDDFIKIEELQSNIRNSTNGMADDCLAIKYKNKLLQDSSEYTIGAFYNDVQNLNDLVKEFLFIMYSTWEALKRFFAVISMVMAEEKDRTRALSTLMDMLEKEESTTREIREPMLKGEEGGNLKVGQQDQLNAAINETLGRLIGKVNAGRLEYIMQPGNRNLFYILPKHSNEDPNNLMSISSKADEKTFSETKGYLHDMNEVGQRANANYKQSRPSNVFSLETDSKNAFILRDEDVYSKGRNVLCAEKLEKESKFRCLPEDKASNHRL